MEDGYPSINSIMNRPPNLHSNFFSSLKQVEKRLKLENPPPSLSLSPPPPPLQPPETAYPLTESLSSPIFLPQRHHQDQVNQSSNPEFSETPNEFLSNSIDFPPTNQDPPPESPDNHPQTSDLLDDVDVDEIELLIELLGLSDREGDDPNLDLKTCSSCRCGSGFYEKIVGFRGPKCEREVERLEGWIRHFRKEKFEPIILAHLLLGKAAFLSGDDGGFEGLEFPCTVEEFLQIDPPVSMGV